MYILTNIVNDCSNPAVGSIITILKNILKIVQIAGPILLIIALTITITKLVSNPDEKKYKKHIRNELIAILFLFAVPVIVNAFMLMLNNSYDVSICWNSIGNYSYNPDYVKDYDKSPNKLLNNIDDYEKGEERKPENDPNNTSSSNSSGNNSTIAPTNTGSFTKYNLSESQLKQLTALALHEQGTAKGAAAEASLMANRFELYGSKYGSGADGLVSYVRNSGWFASAGSHMADSGIVTSSALNAVRNVLVGGRRTLPGYVDEHDCFSDISSVSTGSVRDRSSYKQFSTKIHNRYGANYTFYSFPDSNSDPFGYTSESKRKSIGDNCYSFEG